MKNRGIKSWHSTGNNSSSQVRNMNSQDKKSNCKRDYRILVSVKRRKTQQNKDS